MRFSSLLRLTAGIILLALIPFMLQMYSRASRCCGTPAARTPDHHRVRTHKYDSRCLFIAVLRLGVVGAAAATALSQSIGGLIPLLYFIFPNKSRLRLGKTHMDFSALLKPVQTALPSL